MEESNLLNSNFDNETKCPHCGKVLPQNASFCPYCGKQIDEKIEPQTVGGVINFKREISGVAKLIKTKIIIDNNTYGELKENEQTSVHLPFGYHNVELKAAGNPSARFQISIDEKNSEIFYPFKISMTGKPSFCGSEISTSSTQNAKSQKKKPGCLTTILIIILGLYLLTKFVGISLDFGTTSNNPKSSKSTISSTSKMTSQLLYDKNGITVTAKNLKGIDTIDLEIENKTEKDISYSIWGIAVNNYMVSDSTYFPTISAGNKSIETCDISSARDMGSRLGDIEKIDFYISFEDTASYENIDKALLRATTDKYSGEEKTYSVAGTVMYEDENVTVHLTKTDDNISKFQYVVENKTDGILDFHIADTAVNGIMLEDMYTSTFYYSEILPHCIGNSAKSTSSITVWSAFNDMAKESKYNPVNKITGKPDVYITYLDKKNAYYTGDTITVYEK